MKRWCRVAIWFVIEAGTWGSGNVDELLHRSLQTSNNKLDSWYRRRHRENPREKLTRISKMTKGKLGTRAEQTCDTKGAEAWGLLKYLCEVIEAQMA
eukprot:12427944-Karenia_brevis.AAC.1